jgi:hypothetical protein
LGNIELGFVARPELLEKISRLGHRQDRFWHGLQIREADNPIRLWLNPMASRLAVIIVKKPVTTLRVIDVFVIHNGRLRVAYLTAVSSIPSCPTQAPHISFTATCKLNCMKR